MKNRGREGRRCVGNGTPRRPAGAALLIALLAAAPFAAADAAAHGRGQANCLAYLAADAAFDKVAKPYRRTLRKADRVRQRRIESAEAALFEASRRSEMRWESLNARELYGISKSKFSRFKFGRDRYQETMHSIDLQWQAARAAFAKVKKSAEADHRKAIEAERKSYEEAVRVRDNAYIEAYKRPEPNVRRRVSGYERAIVLKVATYERKHNCPRSGAAAG